MVAENPFADFRSECEQALEKALDEAFPKVKIKSLSFEKPSNPDYGQLASSLCFELARHVHGKPIELAKRLARAVDADAFSLIERVEPAGAGYVNFHARFADLSALVLKSIRALDTGYGFVKTDRPLKAIVEHTSANPLHPIHIGQARNPILGDTVARMLSARGHEVFRHYYVDDVGRQSSVLAYGYEKLGRPKPDAKPDQFLGRIYTITSCLVEIRRLKKALEQAREVSADEEATKYAKELDEWAADAVELNQKFPDLFGNLLREVDEDENPEASINRLNRAYEEGETQANSLVREVAQLCFGGFKETLGKIGISFDSWDWESDFVRGGHVAEVLQKFKASPYVLFKEGVLEFDAEKAAQGLDLKHKLGLKVEAEIPPLTLVRSDGTTLYTTRDVAYTLWKFERADKVINVIGMEQNLAQLQLKIAMYALGYEKQADSLFHFAYNLVSVPGYKMSSRRGHYITLDEVMDEAVRRAYEEVSKRSPELSDEEKKTIADFVGIGAVRYALIEVDTSKPVLFTWDRVLNFERNSAPYVQYTHARASSILRKADRKAEKPGYSLLTEKLERELILTLANFPDAFIEAAEYLKPNAMAEYANSLADRFNTFYNAVPVLKAEPIELSNARLVLTDAVRIVLRNSLNLIGVIAPEKM